MKRERIYCDGVYDLFHLGHMQQLESIKANYPDSYLIVGVCNDEEVTRHKRVPIQSFDERSRTIRHCRWVDEVIEGPWYLTEQFLDDNNINFVAHDDEPYAAPGHVDLYGWIKESGKFIATERTKGISTSNLLYRVLSRRDEYMALLEKKGYQFGP